MRWYTNQMFWMFFFICLCVLLLSGCAGNQSWGESLVNMVTNELSLYLANPSAFHL